MAFGNAVTDFSQQAIGSYGYTIKVPLEPSGLNANVVYAVQGQVGASDTPQVVLTKVLQSTIEDYLNSSSCPDLAFATDGTNVIVFFKTTVFAYVSDTRIAFLGLRNAQPTASDNDKLDIIDDDIGLLRVYAIQEMYLLKQNFVPQNILDTISNEETRITNE